MSLVRFLPAWLHAVADYAVGTLVIVAAVAVGGTGFAVATGVIVGAVVLVVSMLTKYPLGIVKVLPFTVHSAGDYLAAVLLIGAPFVLNFNNSDMGLTILYVGSGIAVLAASLITNYQYGPAAAETSAPALVVEPVTSTPKPRRAATTKKTATAKATGTRTAAARKRPLVADRSRRSA